MNGTYRALLALFGMAALCPTRGTAADVIYLDQGWSTEVREKVYRTSQGSELMPYAWFLALEQPYSEKLILDDKYISSFGYLPEAKSPSNPDGLPIGFTKNPNKLGEMWMGLSCAACHAGQFT